MILIAAGSSLPFSGIDSQHIVLAAFSALGRLTKIHAVSPLYLCPAWPDPADPPFVNAVARIDANLEPDLLLAALHAIEAGFARRRGQKNAPRTLDLDLLCLHDQQRDGTGPSGLVLPHPGLLTREFVLAPLCDIEPHWRHPATGETALALLNALPDRHARRIK